MMKALLCLLPLASLTIRAQIPTPDIRLPEVRKSLQLFVPCWESHDADCIDKLLTQDFEFFNRTGIAINKGDFLQLFKDGTRLPKIPVQVQAEKIAIHFYGPIAIVTVGVTIPKEARVPAPLDTAPSAAVPVLPELTLIWYNSDGSGWQLGRGQVYYQEVVRFTPPQVPFQTKQK
jgi:hypothetical protein